MPPPSVPDVYGLHDSDSLDSSPPSWLFGDYDVAPNELDNDGDGAPATGALDMRQSANVIGMDWQPPSVPPPALAQPHETPNRAAAGQARSAVECITIDDDIYSWTPDVPLLKAWGSFKRV